jgi:hypothetical protein
MEPRDFPHHDYPYLDFPYTGQYYNDERPAPRKKPGGNPPQGGAPARGNARSILGTLAIGILYSPFWLAGLSITQILHPHSGVALESILDFCLFTGLTYGLFVYIRSAYRRLQKKGSPLWIPLFLLTLMVISGLPGWWLFECLPPVLHQLGSPASYALLPAAGLAWLLFHYHRLLPRR